MVVVLERSSVHHSSSSPIDSVPRKKEQSRTVALLPKFFELVALGESVLGRGDRLWSIRSNTPLHLNSVGMEVLLRRWSLCRRTT